MNVTIALDGEKKIKYPARFFSPRAKDERKRSP